MACIQATIEKTKSLNSETSGTPEIPFWEKTDQFDIYMFRFPLIREYFFDDDTSSMCETVLDYEDDEETPSYSEIIESDPSLGEQITAFEDKDIKNKKSSDEEVSDAVE